MSLAGLSLLVLVTWILQRPYRGLNHDAVIYSFLALARLHPTSLAHDLIVRFGSQDSYTVFSPLYSAIIRALDLEPAAALLTFLGQAAFFVAAWFLARRCMSPGRALLAVGLLIALPSNYGARQSFGYIEGFLTPRQMTEALVLASLAASLSGRRILGGGALAVGLLLHPIMASAGLVFLAFQYVAIPRPKLAIALGAALAAASLTVAVLWLHAFDETWLAMTRAYGYLFVSQWTLSDWGRLCLPAGILLVGLLVNTSPLVKKLCAAALMTAACGITATVVFCDLLHVVLVTQLQPWRWVWPAHVIALLLLPLIVPDCWRASSLARAAVILIIAASLLHDLPIAPPVLVLGSLVCAASARRLTNPRHARLILLGSGAVLVLAALMSLLPHTLANAPDQAVLTLPGHIAQWMRKWAGGGLLYAVLLGLALAAAERHSTAANTLVLGAAAALVCILAPVGWQSWTSYRYTADLRERFSQWRNAIPAHAEVFWTTSPVAVWYLLERPDYWAPAQGAGEIFSRTQAIETQRRAGFVSLTLEAIGQRHPPEPDPQSVWYRPPQQIAAENLDGPGLTSVCSDPELSFVVSRILIGPTPYPPITPNPGERARRLYLYRCADVRQ